MKQKFDISRSSIMDLVSAITAQIAQQNSVDPDTLWASPSDYAKLDVYYHEAITRLEVALAKQVTPSVWFVPMEEGQDYSLIVNLSDRWNTKLRNLVINRIQEYFVHSILQAWIAGFHIELAAADYSSLVVNDLPAIVDLLLRVKFSTEGSERQTDRIHINDTYESSTKQNRITDRIYIADGSITTELGDRLHDTDKLTANGSPFGSAEGRGADNIDLTGDIHDQIETRNRRGHDQGEVHTDVLTDNYFRYEQQRNRNFHQFGAGLQRPPVKL